MCEFLQPEKDELDVSSNEIHWFPAFSIRKKMGNARQLEGRKNDSSNQ